MASIRKWTCFDCDWDNDLSLSVCEMCDTARAASCVARSEREDAAAVTAKQRELAELQRLQEEERMEADRQEHLRMAREAAMVHAQQAQEQRRLQEVKIWAETRLAQLKGELRSIQNLASNLRRQRLRALQLELHPDKQPEDRRLAVQPLFLLVQQEWEAQPVEDVETFDVKTPGAGAPVNHPPSGQRPSTWDWARQRATAFSEQEAKQTQNAQRTKAKDRKEVPKPAPKAATKPQPRHFTFSTDDISDDDLESHSDGTQLEMGTHWTPELEDDEDAGIVPLLATGSFENAMHAFTSIQLARRSRGLEAEKMDHPWRKKMDRLEAEAWRIYAQQQGQQGFQKFAIAEHLHRAISLHPERGELYYDRAMCRARISCRGASVAELRQLQDKEFQKVLADCEKALAWDSSLLDAFDLALRLQLVGFNLSKVCDLAIRGHKSALAMGDDDKAADFASWRRCARVVGLGLERAQNALAAKQPNDVSQIVEAVKAAALPEMEDVLTQRVEHLLRQADTQRQFQEAYATAGEDAWAAAWGF